MTRQPWHGIVVAIPTLFHEDLSMDLDGVQDHIVWLAENGCHGVAPAGSLGEYQVLTNGERTDLIRAAVEAAPKGFSVISGVSAYGGDEAFRWAEDAARAGADAVMCQPPNSYRADEREVVAHFVRVAEAGLPIMAYNNPSDNRVDLTPNLLHAVADSVPLVVAIKDFSGIVSRAYQIRALTPRIDIIAGMDGVVVELLLAGAKGWLAGFPNSLPRLSARLYDAAVAGDLEAALEIYESAQLLFHWDSHHHFVQAVKLSMDAAGRYGGPVRLPRLPLDAEDEAEIKGLTLKLTAIE
jgi:dihydrodipicolinate synthase/N-acetylneuraminate lyase